MRSKTTYLLLLILSYLYGECSDLSYAECSQWSDYCEWDEENGVCQDLEGGGDGGDSYNLGPYEFAYLTESEGIQNSDLYSSAVLYYPIDAIPPYKSVVLIDAFGSQPGLINWAQFYASHGYIGMSIGNLDEFRRDSNSDWDYMDRAIALLDAVETIKLENERAISPLFNLIDTTNFAVSGYSTSGGGAHTALTIDSTLKTGILLNPAVAFLDSINCTAESDYYCLIEEHLDHNVPVLIFAGENEYNELVTPDDDVYSNMWALPQYEYVPDDTDKLYFESANEGHGSSYIPSEFVGKQALFWLNYYMKNDTSYCDSITTQPDGVSSFLTTIACEQVIDSVESCILGDVYVSEGHNSGDPEDYIEIYNSGDYDCSLEGFQLDDNEELNDFTFGDVIVSAGGHWVGYEDQDSSFTSGLGSNGDIIVFADSSGNSLIVELEASTELDGVSLSQSFDGDGNGCFTLPTPGTLNSECITFSVASCNLEDVYVSEGHNSGDPEDYIEIYNSSDYDCSLEGFQLDDNEELDDLTFGTVIIPAGGYWVGYEDEDGSFSSGLSSNGDIIVFADSSGNSLIVELEASTELDSVSLSQSFDENGNGCFTVPTPGSSNGECLTLSLEESHLPPPEYLLSQNYPNPFNPVTNISYTLSHDSYVNIDIYDLKGSIIKSLVNSNLTEGFHSVRWDATNEFGENIPAGVYFYTINTNSFNETKKMIYIK
jgi:hypothetical protein